MTSREQEMADILTCGYNVTEKQLLAFVQMVGHLIMTEDLAIDREESRIYWTVTGETLGDF